MSNSKNPNEGKDFLKHDDDDQPPKETKIDDQDAAPASKLTDDNPRTALD